MNAENQKFNEKDNEMVQLTKVILKQTARHTRWPVFGPVECDL